jgi:glycopeptide antibiotics resistance protein
MKSEMKFHLIETVEELKKEGKSEEESIRIAISRFGEIPQIKSELSSVIPITRKTLNTAVWASVAAIVLTFVFIIIAINQDGANVELEQGFILVFGIPIYIIIKSTRLDKMIRLNQSTDLKKEVLIVLFFIYMLYLVGTTSIFPIHTYPNFYSNMTYSINVIPFINLPEHIIGMSNKGLTTFIIVRRFFKIFIRYIPLGILAPMLWPKFRTLKKSLLLGVIVYMGFSIAEAIMVLTGMSLTRGIWFDIDDMLVGMLGVLVGYFIYKTKWKKTFNHKSIF